MKTLITDREKKVWHLNTEYKLIERICEMNAARLFLPQLQRRRFKKRFINIFGN